MAETLLKVENLQAWYGESHILHGVDLTVNRGEVVTLLGRNGMGKTTTIRTLMGLLPARGGTAHFEGEALNANDGVLNGGIIGALLDCHSNWTAAHHLMIATGAGAWTGDERPRSCRRAARSRPAGACKAGRPAAGRGPRGVCGESASFDVAHDVDATAELEDAFAGPLTFGTAGLRGRVGPGPNRMNIVVVARAAAGLRQLDEARHHPGG